MHKIDLSVLMWFNQVAGRSHAFDWLAATVTDYAPVLFLLLFAGYFFWPGASLRMRRSIVLSGLSGVVGLAFAVVLASLFYRGRPFTVLSPAQLHQLVPHPADSSFPSDHATGSAAFAAGMWASPSASARWAFLALALVVGLSRLVVGVHWPSDILASFVLGALAAALTFRAARPLAPLLNRTLEAVAQAESRLRKH